MKRFYLYNDIESPYRFQHLNASQLIKLSPKRPIHEENGDKLAKWLFYHPICESTLRNWSLTSIDSILFDPICTLIVILTQTHSYYRHFMDFQPTCSNGLLWLQSFQMFICSNCDILCSVVCTFSYMTG